MMDSLVETLATSFTVSCVENNTAAPHPRFSQYKTKTSSSSQEERRKQFLEQQKLKREKQIEKSRNLGEDNFSDEDHNENRDEEEITDMEVSLPLKKHHRPFRNSLMLSEWLVEVPDDMETEWLLVLCPVGKRCLVLASKGTTRAFSKSGYKLNQFPSHLPAGNRHQSKYSTGGTLLDCIYCEREKTYYVLDVMCWKGNSVVDSETEFRIYWLKTKIDEHPDVKNYSSRNPYKFVPLPYYSCQLDEVEKALASSFAFSSELDGLLFIHKRTHYTRGVTPLACWLKPYMCPEILKISVPETLCKDKPPSYISMEEQLPHAFKKHHRRKQAEASIMDHSELT